MLSHLHRSEKADLVLQLRRKDKSPRSCDCIGCLTTTILCHFSRPWGSYFARQPIFPIERKMKLMLRCSSHPGRQKNEHHSYDTVPLLSFFWRYVWMVALQYHLVVANHMPRHMWRVSHNQSMTGETSCNNAYDLSSALQINCDPSSLKEGDCCNHISRRMIND